MALPVRLCGATAHFISVFPLRLLCGLCPRFAWVLSIREQVCTLPPSYYSRGAYLKNALGTYNTVLSGLEARFASRGGDGTGLAFIFRQVIQVGQWFETTKVRNDFRDGWLGKHLLQ